MTSPATPLSAGQHADIPEADERAICVRRELCLLRPAARTSSDLLNALAAAAVDHGYAHATFPDALLAREHAHPTGLPTPVAVAVPHADPEHVRRPGIGLALVPDGVPFVQMGTDDTEVSVKLAVLLLVTDPSRQVGVLSAVLRTLQSPRWFDGARSAATVDELIQAVGIPLLT